VSSTARAHPIKAEPAYSAPEGDLLGSDILLLRPFQRLSLGSESHEPLPVVTLLDRTERLQQRQHLAPRDVVAHRMPEYLRKGLAQRLMHVRPDRRSRATRAELLKTIAEIVTADEAVWSPGRLIVQAARKTRSKPDSLRGQRSSVDGIVIAAIVVAAVAVLALLLAIRIVQQYEMGVHFRLGKVIGVRAPGLRPIVPVIDVLRRVSLRIVTMPIQSQGIITKDNVSIDVSAVAYFKVVDAVKSVVAIENVGDAINQIAQTTLRKVVGQHTLDETLSETDRINLSIREILDVATQDWGLLVTLVELKDIQLPDSMKRAMARQAEAEREKRAKIIAAEGEALAADKLGVAADIMMAHPLALQLRNLQSLVEIGVDKNTTVVFPAPLMSTIQELGNFVAREKGASESVRRPLAPAATKNGGNPLT
jgi:regulator of protease activity HflC (stomatin/prohibitin superfamily)